VLWATKKQKKWTQMGTQDQDWEPLIYPEQQVLRALLKGTSTDFSPVQLGYSHGNLSVNGPMLG
jgi:hypothetical protein